MVTVDVSRVILLQDMQKRYEDVVRTYRSHLLAAVQVRQNMSTFCLLPQNKHGAKSQQNGQWLLANHLRTNAHLLLLLCGIRFRLTVTQCIVGQSQGIFRSATSANSEQIYYIFKVCYTCT